MRHAECGLAFASVAILALSAVGAAHAQRPGPPGAAFTRGSEPAVIEAVVLHPFVSQDFSCSEHGFDVSGSGVIILGDALGADCTVIQYDRAQTGRRPPRYFRTDGSTNEDWLGWGKLLLAPFDGVIEEVHINAVTNVPGTPGRGPSSFIVFLRDDGTRVTYGHVDSVKVKQGDRVTAGQAVAAIGNNGFGYSPHTHIGAWRGSEPLQIRFDQRALGRLAAIRQ